MFQVASKQWTPETTPNDDLTKLCNHKRKLLAMASFHTSQLSNSAITTPAPTSCSANMFHNNAGELATLDDNIPEPNAAIPPTKGTVKLVVQGLFKPNESESESEK